MGRKGDRDQKRMVSVYLPDIYSHVERPANKSQVEISDF